MSLSRTMTAGFVDPNAAEIVGLKAAKTFEQMAELKAAGVTDYQNFGTLLTPQFDKEISDIARRRGVFGQLLKSTPAVGHPHRYFEQEDIPNGQGFSDPRTLNTTYASNGASLRVEKAAFVRAMTGGIQFGLFDQQTAGQTSAFPQLVAKDLKDMVTGLLRQEDIALWNGSAVSLTDGASTQYSGISKQISNTLTVAKGADIIDAIRTKVAQMMANPNVAVKPSHIFVNPELLDYIEKEIKNSANSMKTIDAGTVEVVPGVEVRAIMTAAGKLPVIPAWEMAKKANGTVPADTDYPIAILDMDNIEAGYIGSPEVQLFKLGLDTGLADKYQAVKFNTGAIVKHASVAHAFGYVTR